MILIISDKADSERDAVAAAWESKYGSVLRLGRFWAPPKLSRQEVRVYGADTFCLVLAQKLDIALVSPKDDLIFSLPYRFVKRDINRLSLSEKAEFQYPLFYKPLIPKLFRANVFQSEEELEDECRGLEDNTEVLSSEVVKFIAEARFFICHSKIATYAVYEGEVPVNLLKNGIKLVEDLMLNTILPRTVVIDIGLIKDKDWCVIEFNASWGSGLNGCDPSKVIDCILASVDTSVL